MKLTETTPKQKRTFVLEFDEQELAYLGCIFGNLSTNREKEIFDDSCADFKGEFLPNFGGDLFNKINTFLMNDY